MNLSFTAIAVVIGALVGGWGSFVLTKGYYSPLLKAEEQRAENWKVSQAQWEATAGNCMTKVHELEEATKAQQERSKVAVEMAKQAVLSRDEVIRKIAAENSKKPTAYIDQCIEASEAFNRELAAERRSK